MPAVEVNHIVKSYADKAVVNDLSFSVAQGEIFGLNWSQWCWQDHHYKDDDGHHQARLGRRDNPRREVE